MRCNVNGWSFDIEPGERRVRDGVVLDYDEIGLFELEHRGTVPAHIEVEGEPRQPGQARERIAPPGFQLVFSIPGSRAAGLERAFAAGPGGLFLLKAMRDRARYMGNPLVEWTDQAILREGRPIDDDEDEDDDQ